MLDNAKRAIPRKRLTSRAGLCFCLAFIGAIGPACEGCEQPLLQEALTIVTYNQRSAFDVVPVDDPQGVPWRERYTNFVADLEAKRLRPEIIALQEAALTIRCGDRDLLDPYEPIAYFLTLLSSRIGVDYRIAHAIGHWESTMDNRLEGRSLSGCSYFRLDNVILYDPIFLTHEAVRAEQGRIDEYDSNSYTGAGGRYEGPRYRLSPPCCLAGVSRDLICNRMDGDLIERSCGRSPSGVAWSTGLAAWGSGRVTGAVARFQYFHDISKVIDVFNVHPGLAAQNEVDTQIFFSFLRDVTASNPMPFAPPLIAGDFNTARYVADFFHVWPPAPDCSIDIVMAGRREAFGAQRSWVSCVDTDDGDGKCGGSLPGFVGSCLSKDQIASDHCAVFAQVVARDQADAPYVSDLSCGAPCICADSAIMDGTRAGEGVCRFRCLSEGHGGVCAKQCSCGDDAPATNACDATVQCESACS